MYKNGDLVVYGAQGVCRITGDTTKVIGGKKLSYLVLEPLDHSGATCYIPSDNPNALAKLRPLLDKDTLERVLSSEEFRNAEWIEDENQRKQYYRELIACGDRVSIMLMIHRLHQHKQLQQSTGRKMHLCDENFLRDAQKLLDPELSLAFGLKTEEVSAYVLSVLHK